MVTKEQERKALAKIEAILAELGEDSYVGMAMKGVIDDAKQNIENDWGMSYYDRCEHLEYELDMANEAREAAEAEKAALEHQLEQTEAKVLSTRDNRLIRRLLWEYSNGEANDKAACEAAIIENCENPESDAYKQAVIGRRVAQTEITYAEKMIEALDKVNQ